MEIEKQAWSLFPLVLSAFGYLRFFCSITQQKTQNQDRQKAIDIKTEVI